MENSRRELATLLPLLFTAGAAAAAEDKEAILPSKCYPYDQLPVKTNPKTHNETRQVFTGLDHDKYPVDLHITKLAPGQMPHPQHQHVHEELVFVREGTLEVYILDATTRIGPGSVAYVKSNERHGWKNVGDTSAEYFVLALGRQEKS
jgi:quercetin dioxygenase-like cupin family protein